MGSRGASSSKSGGGRRYSVKIKGAQAIDKELSKLHYEQFIVSGKMKAADNAAKKALREAKKELAKPKYSTAIVDRWMKKANDATSEYNAAAKQMDKLLAKEDKIRDEGIKRSS